jgi:hypothetical protein
MNASILPRGFGIGYVAPIRIMNNPPNSDYGSKGLPHWQRSENHQNRPFSSVATLGRPAIYWRINVILGRLPFHMLVFDLDMRCCIST